MWTDFLGSKLEYLYEFSNYYTLVSFLSGKALPERWQKFKAQFRYNGLCVHIIFANIKKSYLCPGEKTSNYSLNPSMKSNRTKQPVTTALFAVMLIGMDLALFISGNHRSRQNIKQKCILVDINTAHRHLCWYVSCLFIQVLTCIYVYFNAKHNVSSLNFETKHSTHDKYIWQYFHFVEPDGALKTLCDHCVTTVS